MRTQTPERSRRGFTLVELMISVAVMGIVVMYLTQSFTTQHRTYVVMDQVTEAQQNMRAISDLVEREIRLAGFLVPEGAAVCGADVTNGADTLFVSDADSLDPTNQKKDDLGATLPAGTVSIAAGMQNLTLNSLTLDGASFYDTDNNGVADSDFRCDSGNCAAGTGRAAGGVIVVDKANPGRGAACGVIDRVVGANTIRVNLLNPLAGYVAGSNTPVIVAVPAHSYTINAQRQLLRDNLMIANDVEDLQLAYFFDVNGDRNVNSAALEYPGSAGGAVYFAQNWDASKLREVRVNFVVRTRAADDGLTEGQFQNTENRAAPVVQDGFRRRVHTATVRLRNVGTRG